MPETKKITNLKGQQVLNLAESLPHGNFKNKYKNKFIFNELS
jgi:hypothetical protein